MMSYKEFASSQADRESQLRFSAQQQAARPEPAAKVGPVFGPLLALLGEGMILVGTRLHERYAEICAEEAVVPSPNGRAVPQP